VEADGESKAAEEGTPRIGHMEKGEKGSDDWILRRIYERLPGVCDSMLQKGRYFLKMKSLFTNHIISSIQTNHYILGMLTTK